MTDQWTIAVALWAEGAHCYGSFHLTAAANIMLENQLSALIEFALYSPIVQGKTHQNVWTTQKQEAI